MRQREHRRISVAHIDGLFPTTSCRLVSNLKQAERFLAGPQLRTSQDRLTAARICLNAPISISSNSFRATLRLLLCHEGHLLSLQRTCKLQDRLCAQLMLGSHGPFAPLARAAFFLDDVHCWEGLGFRDFVVRNLKLENREVRHCGCSRLEAAKPA